jgi:uncharacterized membrane protein (GlpM family)
VTSIIAHAGHWAVSLAYLVPVFALIVWLAVSTLRERKRLRMKANAGTTHEPDQDD